jgi:tetratricopeptide (TPR) repeat protein
MRQLLALLALLATVGCGDASAPAAVADPGDAVALATVQAAQATCLSDDAEAGIARLDTLIAARPDDIDALATRGLCRHVRFAADSSRADAQAAMDDLTAAAERLDAGGTSAIFTLDRIYSHRAFVRAALGPGDWPAAVEDLERAAQLAPDEATYRIDLGVARGLAGDTAGAIADLRQFLVMAPDDTARIPVVERQLRALGDSSGTGRRP